MLCLLCSGTGYPAEGDPLPQAVEPDVYDHYRFLKRMQEHVASRSLEEQAQWHPHLQRAERHACQRLKEERDERVTREDYRRQGGDELLTFILQLEQYCETLP